MPKLTVSRVTFQRLKNHRVTGEFDESNCELNPDGTVTFDISGELFSRLQELQSKGESIENVIVRLLIKA